MRTFSVQVLGCRVNHYEGEQIAYLLRDRGLVQVADPSAADLRVVHTCSVTHEAARKSAQLARRMTRLPAPSKGRTLPPGDRAKTVVTGCWATSDPTTAGGIPGIDAVISHHEDLPGRLHTLLDHWLVPDAGGGRSIRLPVLQSPPAAHQRAFLKVQDGCDAHCTYCIIPRLRPRLSSKPVEEVVQEARELVARGHQEIVLTGIFLGAYGQPTALRRRQPRASEDSMICLIEALCTRVDGLRRLRLSSLEPGDITPRLIQVLSSCRQVVPHFHLPLQSGSDAILRRMNRQYRRKDYLLMVDQLRAAFDRPAITTDIIAGFPGETEADFAQTLDLVEQVEFAHIHAFPFSPRPGTAAGRWKDRFLPAAVVQRRMSELQRQSQRHSLAFRQRFLGQTVEVLVERGWSTTMRHGRCERYFSVCFAGDTARPGDLIPVRVEQVTLQGTWGSAVTADGARAR
ncbi:MAG: MiaB/RimO family radical SAM methylthiotransferase [Phycisphaerae bacterium]|nr:MiaB/RimO family radical SAM methylthiotransferase [Phycisphaerae bacterium]MDW8261244.1 MiaB/RimO family radical SAM methylthiotransferase [Phycisphaerales bacterium]